MNKLIITRDINISDMHIKTIENSNYIPQHAHTIKIEGKWYDVKYCVTEILDNGDTTSVILVGKGY